MKEKGKRLIRAEDLLKMKFVRSVAMSPDESRIAYTLEWIDEKEKKYFSHLWLVNVSDGSSTQFTFGKVKDREPCWSPDGKRIAFLSTREEKEGIYVIPANGGEARKLVEMEGTFRHLSWSPKGNLLVCSFRKKDPSPEGSDKKAPPVYRHITRLCYKLDGEGYRPQDGFHIWTFDPSSGKGIQLTRGKYDEIYPSFSPNGEKIAFVSNRQKDPDRDSLREDLWVIGRNGGKPNRIPTPPGPVAAPNWSPDGKTIAYLGHTKPEDTWWINNYHIWIVPSSGKGKDRDLMPNFDRMVMDLTLSDTAEGHSFLPPLWSANGKFIYFLATDEGNTHPFSVTIAGGKVTRLLSQPMRVMWLSAAGKKKKLAILAADPYSPGDLWFFQLADNKVKRLTEVNRELFSQLELSRPEEVRYTSFDGTKIQAWILKPPRMQKRKYPAIVEIHGGPRMQYGNVFFHEFQLLTANGYVVFYTNPRGSQGRGEAFAGAIKGNWGELDYKDIMAGVDYLVKRQYVDPKKLGVTGGSYGGYMTNWIIGHTDRFKAAVTQRSLSNLISDFGSSDFGFEHWREFGAHPWERLEDYLRLSPITYVTKIKTPLLIIHSENDLRCPIEQAEQLYMALKILKRPVEFIRFPEESHGLSRCGCPDRRIERLKRIRGWFDRYLK